MASLNLFGATTLAPLANTIYDCVVNAGTNPDQNNEVYIYCDTSAGGDITLRLPSLKLYNGIWNTKIYVVDVGNNASGSNITIDAGTTVTNNLLKLEGTSSNMAELKAFDNTVVFTGTTSIGVTGNQYGRLLLYGNSSPTINADFYNDVNNYLLV